MASFNVMWNSNNKPGKGKVFARKRKGNTLKGGNNATSESDTTEIKTQEEENGALNKQSEVNKKVQKDSLSKTDTFKIKNRNRKNNSSEVTDSENPTAQKFIKRKQKKDKLIAKLTGNNEITAVNKINTHSLFAVDQKEIHIQPNVRGKSLVEKVFDSDNKFSDLDIHRYIAANLEKAGFQRLTNVQEKAIPVILDGKNVLIRSQTGSGKTLAYAVPILDALQTLSPKLQRNDGVQVIIIVPTRELALQTHELFGKINTFQWIVVGHLCGGENRNTEKNRLRKGVHILIGTPGRLLDHILHTSAFKTNKVRCLVLDEADRLLDMGFKKDIKRIVEELDKTKEYDPFSLLKSQHYKDHKEPEGVTGDDEHIMSLKNANCKLRQTILLSATLTKGIAELADFTMKEHTYIDALDEEISNFKSDLMVIPNTVDQKFLVTHVKHRLFTLSSVLITLTKKFSKIFVFMGTSTMVDFHYTLFTKFLVKMPKNRGRLKSGNVVVLQGIEDDSDDEEIVLNAEFFKLHGSMDQSARKDVFTRFRAEKKGILLCTDVVARGIDVPTADCIIQYNGPQSVEDYLHRVGRTGRAGKSGTSYIFLTHEEQDFITKMEEYKVFLKQQDTEYFLDHLSDVMDEPDHQLAAIALQRHYENVISSDSDLHKLACLAYSSWSRFYNTYSNKMRSIFDFKKVNLGHYVTSFGLKETPTQVGKIVRGQVSKVEQPRLNRKLANHENEESPKPVQQKRKIKSVSLTTSEFSSGLPQKKKKKKLQEK